MIQSRQQNGKSFLQYEHDAPTDVKFWKVEEVFSEQEHFCSRGQDTVQAEARLEIPASVQGEEKGEKESGDRLENIEKTRKIQHELGKVKKWKIALTKWGMKQVRERIMV